MDTTLAATTVTLLLDPVADGNAGSTALQVSHTVYVPPPFVLILLPGGLSPSKAWRRLRGALFASNLENDFFTVVDWLQATLARSTPNDLSHLITVDPTAPLADSGLLKHRHTVLIRDLPSLDPELSWATGSMITENIGDLVTKQRAARMEAETIQRRKKDEGEDTLTGAAHRALLKISRCTYMSIRTTPLWPALAWAPKYWKLAELQDQLDRTA